jgi:hypothetical protein
VAKQLYWGMAELSAQLGIPARSLTVMCYHVPEFRKLAHRFGDRHYFRPEDLGKIRLVIAQRPVRPPARMPKQPAAASA